ncbi:MULTISPECIES: glycosyltransferase [Shouchella]|uniref:Glycosyltransferase family 2 protein n=1 Tax=Shouchella hunanensis TaxID=766894 RepID=A0ABY7W4W4_9BACI|nr:MULTISPECIES: glycosyltransferase family 2 protein [Shouchella]WDF03995.1 glycosyltransferase family 2 protein [Shouchella hunanensis]GAF23414.1 glycosyltransferase, group 2 family protein [Bacillus sp. JCM 19047]
MIEISLCLIVKNEEAVLERCLSSVKEVVDEIIILDTGSTDRTKEIATSFTDKVYDFTWVNHFAKARNKAFSYATKPYVMWLDADDILKEEDRQKLKLLKSTLEEKVDAVSMDYHLAFDGNGGVTSSIRRFRIVKKERGFVWHGAVHEYLEVYGELHHSDIAVTHLSADDGHDLTRNLDIYEGMKASGEAFTPRDLLYYANELTDHRRFEDAVEYYLKFIKTDKGWSEDLIRSCNKLADCYINLGLPKVAKDWTFRALEYGKPKPETCCRIGHSFMEKQAFSEAVFWYEMAIRNKEENAYFQNVACETWIPNLQLAVCYDKLGFTEKANEHNEQAATFLPDDSRIEYNRSYFKEQLQLLKQND